MKWMNYCWRCYFLLLLLKLAIEFKAMSSKQYANGNYHELSMIKAGLY